MGFAHAQIEFAKADVKDFLASNYIPDSATCPGGCAEWASASDDPKEQARLNSFWKFGKPPPSAGNSCAMPGASAGYDLGDGRYIDHIFNSFAENDGYALHFVKFSQLQPGKKYTYR